MIGYILVGVLLCGLIAFLFGRSKHIGGYWSFFLLIGNILVGIIALIASPSAKNPPTKPKASYSIWGVIVIILGIINVITGINDLFLLSGAISFIILGAYLIQLSKGKVINRNPIFPFDNFKISSNNSQHTQYTHNHPPSNNTTNEFNYNGGHNAITNGGNIVDYKTSYHENEAFLKSSNNRSGEFNGNNPYTKNN